MKGEGWKEGREEKFRLHMNVMLLVRADESSDKQAKLEIPRWANRDTVGPFSLNTISWCLDLPADPTAFEKVY